MAKKNPLDKIAAQAAESIAIILETSKYELGVQLIRVVDDLDTLLQIDIDELYGAKVINGVEIFKATHTKALGVTEAFSAVEGGTLATLLEFDIDLFNKSVIQPIASQIRQTVAKGISTGLTESQMVAMIKSDTLSKKQIMTVVNTQLNNYSRAVTNEMMKTAPDSAMFEYIGPQDDKTRDICASMGAAGEMTQTEIVNSFGNEVLIAGGGYNCRHKWEISSV